MKSWALLASSRGPMEILLLKIFCRIAVLVLLFIIPKFVKSGLQTLSSQAQANGVQPKSTQPKDNQKSESPALLLFDVCAVWRISHV